MSCGEVNILVAMTDECGVSTQISMCGVSLSIPWDVCGGMAMSRHRVCGE